MFAEPPYCLSFAGARSLRIQGPLGSGSCDPRKSAHQKKWLFGEQIVFWDQETRGQKEFNLSRNEEHNI